MAWLYLIIGGVFESLFAFSLGKISESQGRETIFWVLSFLLSVALSMWFLYKAIDTGLGIGVSYAIWGAIGVAGSVLLGYFYFQEPLSFWKLFFLSTLVISVIGLNLSSAK